MVVERRRFPVTEFFGTRKTLLVALLSIELAIRRDRPMHKETSGVGETQVPWPNSESLPKWRQADLQLVL